MRTRIQLVLSVGLMLALGLSLRADSPLVATFINVGQGDCCWLHLPNGDDILVDGGKPRAGPTVVAYLQQHGVTDIDLMVATHGDEDHIGGLDGSRVTCGTCNLAQLQLGRDVSTQ